MVKSKKLLQQAREARTMLLTEMAKPRKAQSVLLKEEAQKIAVAKRLRARRGKQ